MRVTLPKDRWAEILDADDMPHSVKVAVDKLYPRADPDHPTDSTRFTPEWLNASQDMMLAHIITDWSFDQPIPNEDPAKVAFMPIPARQVLIEATYPHWEALGFSIPRPDEPNTNSDGTPSTSGSATTSAASSPKAAKPTPAAS